MNLDKVIFDCAKEFKGVEIDINKDNPNMSYLFDIINSDIFDALDREYATKRILELYANTHGMKGYRISRSSIKPYKDDALHVVVGYIIKGTFVNDEE